MDEVVNDCLHEAAELEAAVFDPKQLLHLVCDMVVNVIPLPMVSNVVVLMCLVLDNIVAAEIDLKLRKTQVIGKIEIDFIQMKNVAHQLGKIVVVMVVPVV